MIQPGKVRSANELDHKTPQSNPTNRPGVPLTPSSGRLAGYRAKTGLPGSESGLTPTKTIRVFWSLSELVVMSLWKQTYHEFSKDRCTQMAAALAFYTMLCLVPLLLLIVTVASLVVGDQAQQALTQQARTMMGSQGAQELQELMSRGRQQQSGLMAPETSPNLAHTEQTEPSPAADGAASSAEQASTVSSEAGTWAVSNIAMNIVSLLVLVVSATGVVAQLQGSLNQVWQVQPDPERAGIRTLLKKRVLSLAIILTAALLLPLSMLLTTALTALGDQISSALGVGRAISMTVGEVATFLLAVLLFASMFKTLPDARVPWKVTWIGGLMTAALFVLGKFLIGLYLGSKDMSSAYGQAGSLVLVLVWTYYSAVIFFFGAELTKVWARQHGHSIGPSDGAVRVVQHQQTPEANRPPDRE
jgi:membrane protein